MRRLHQIAVITALTVLDAMSFQIGHAKQQLLPGLIAAPELSLYAGSENCIECHWKFYQLWAPFRHGLAMQPFTLGFALENLPPQKRRGHRQVSVLGEFRSPGWMGVGDRPQKQEEKIPHPPCTRG